MLVNQLYVRTDPTFVRTSQARKYRSKLEGGRRSTGQVSGLLSSCETVQVISDYVVPERDRINRIPNWLHDYRWRGANSPSGGTCPRQIILRRFRGNRPCERSSWPAARGRGARYARYTGFLSRERASFITYASASKNMHGAAEAHRTPKPANEIFPAAR